MARALLVGCGCRGRELGRRLLAAGWQVRGTSRRPDALEAIATAGIEPATADPAWPGTVLELVGDVTVVAWLLAGAKGEPAELDALHGPRLERLLEKLVDTPVRGLLYEASPRLGEERAGARRPARSRAAAGRWRIPVRSRGRPRRPRALGSGGVRCDDRAHGASLVSPGAARSRSRSGARA